MAEAAPHAAWHFPYRPLSNIWVGGEMSLRNKEIKNPFFWMKYIWGCIAIAMLMLTLELVFTLLSRIKMDEMMMLIWLAMIY